jgi:hypothetical protein
MRLFAIGLLPAVVSAQFPAPTLRLTQDLYIDAAQHDFEPIRELTVSPKGFIAITQRGDGRVVLFGGDGRLIAEVGRLGAGPGEFRSVHRIGWQGELLWAHDQALNRITLITTMGKVTRTLAIPTIVGPNRKTRQQPIGQWLIPSAFPDANTLILAGGQGAAAQRAPWQRALGDGQMVIALDSSGDFKHLVSFMAKRTDCIQQIQRIAITIPQCPRSLDGRSPNGRLFGAAVTKSVADVRFEVTVTLLTDAGGKVYQRKLPFTGERMSVGQRDSILEREKREGASSPGYAEAISRVTLPQAFEPFRQMLVGDDGTVWIRERNRAGQAIWLLLDQTGTPAGRVTLPLRARLMVASRGQLWGLQEDHDGVESIVRWRVGR